MRFKWKSTIAVGATGAFRSLLRRDRRLACRPFPLDYFRPIEAGAATAMLRHAVARGVENALARFRVFREGREDHAGIDTLTR